jgi:hypothetical protein
MAAVRIATAEPEVEKLSSKKGKASHALFFTSATCMWLDL